MTVPAGSWCADRSWSGGTAAAGLGAGRSRAGNRAAGPQRLPAGRAQSTSAGEGRHPGPDREPEADYRSDRQMLAAAAHKDRHLADRCRGPRIEPPAAAAGCPGTHRSAAARAHPGHRRARLAGAVDWAADRTVADRTVADKVGAADNTAPEPARPELPDRTRNRSRARSAGQLPRKPCARTFPLLATITNHPRLMNANHPGSRHIQDHDAKKSPTP
jgi:hypothetical protein